MVGFTEISSDFFFVSHGSFSLRKSVSSLITISFLSCR